MTDDDRVLVTVAEGVADVRLNRPDKLNALDGRMFAALADTGARLAADPSVRAVVLSGEGRAFCAGLDLSTFQAVGAAGDAAGDAPSAADERGSRATEEPIGVDGGLMRTDGRITHLGQQASWTWRELPVPVIAAITGPCLGGGLQVALGADIRIVAPDAKLSVLEMRWGLIPDMTGTWVLPRLVGDAWARELTYTGRMISGAEAAAIGLASRTSDDPRADALALAAEIAAKSPVAVRHAKRLLEASVAPGRTVADQFLDERSTMAALMGSADNIEAVTAYFEQRPAAFPDPVG